jgi:hypothetical protein
MPKKIEVLTENTKAGSKYHTQKGFEVQVLSIDKTNRVAIVVALANGEQSPIPFGYRLIETVVDVDNPAPANATDDVPGATAKPGHDDTPPANNSAPASVTVSAAVAPPAVVVPPAAPAAPAAPEAVKVKKSKKKSEKPKDALQLELERLAERKRQVLDEKRKLLEEKKRIAAERRKKKEEAKTVVIAMTGVACIDRDVALSEKVKAGMSFAEFSTASGNKCFRYLTAACKMMAAGKSKVEISNDRVHISIIPR